MRHALILLPVLTLGAAAARTAPAHAAPGTAHPGVSDAAVSSDAANLEAALGVQGLPALETDSPPATSEVMSAEAAKVARARSLAPRANYVATSREKVTYAKGNAKSQTALWKALRAGNAKALETALGEGAGVNAPNGRGIAPLMAAAKSGQSELVALLLSRGADLEQTDASGATALFHALEGRAQESADLLLQAGANPNAANTRGETALGRLCASLSFLKASPVDAQADANNTMRRQKVVDLMVSLLCHGADANLAAPGEPMPLALAARAGDVGVVQMLLSGGADATGGGATVPDARDGRFETPLAAVLGAGNRARVEQLFLSDGGLINENLRIELRNAAQQNDLAIVNALLAKGAGVSDGMDRFALLEVAARSSAGGAGGELVRVLAQLGASPLVDDNARRIAFNETLPGEVPLLVEAVTATGAAVGVAFDVVQDEFEPRLTARHLKPASCITEATPVPVGFEASAPLVAATPIPDARFDHVLPALWSNAANLRRQKVEVTPRLTKTVAWRGVEPVASGHILAPSQAEEPRALEVETDAPADVRVAGGITFLRLAQPEAPRLATASFTRIVSTARIAPPARTHSKAPAARVAAKSARAAFDAHYGATQGYTPLIQAARAGQIEAVQVLLDSGADPNARDRDGKTALMHLCGTGRAVWVRHLPRRRVEALVGISDNDPRAVSRVVSYAEKRQWRKWAEDGDVAMAQALIQAGADVNARDRSGKTPLMYAARRSSPGVVRALVAAGANVNAQDRVGKTAIMQIIGGGRVAAASGWISPVLEREARHAAALARGGDLALVQKSRDAQARFELHRDLVQQEAERDDDIILCELRRAKANTGLRDISGRTVLDQAIASGHQSAVRWLMGELY